MLDKIIHIDNKYKLKLLEKLNNNLKPKIIIVVSKNIETIAINIKKFLYELKIECEIKFNISKQDCINSYNMNVLYLFIHTSMIQHNMIPQKFIIYQIEQSNSIWFTEKYLQYLKKSNYIWEFSMKNKILYDNNVANLKSDESDFLPQKKSHAFCSDNNNKISYMMMPFYYNKLSSKILDECDTDIFFYGSDNDRRKNILFKLSEKYNIKIGFKLYGKLKEEMICKSKIIINLHYYQDCALESCRLNEILQYDKIIISEKPSNNDIDNQKLYENLVVFIDEILDDLSNLDQLYEKINFYLDKNNYINFIEKSNINKYELHKKSKANLQKNIENIL
jgi:hypothetical protein